MKIALLPGGFKPPHLGHYNMAKYLADFADKVIVRIGQKEREGIGKELALEVWNFYKEFDPDPRSEKLVISVAQSPSPVKDVYDFVEKIAPEGSTVILGLGEKDASDGRYNSIPKFAEPRNIKADIELVPPQAGGISGTRMREIIKANNKAEFFKYIPDYLPEEIKEEIWTKLIDTTMPTDVEEMMMGTMNAEEMAKHMANMKKLRNYLNKINSHGQMVQVPSKLTKGLRRKLYEGRYDQETLMQSRFIVNIFKANFGEFTEESTEGNIGGVEYELDYIFEPNIKEVGPLPFVIDGEADDDTLQIKIKYNPDKFPEAYTELIPEIKDTIRHELEHIAQFNFSKGVNPNSQKLSKYTWFQYFTFDHEIPAFAQGLYKRAKTKRISFTDAVNEFLVNYLDVLTDEEEIKVKQAWTDYARKNLPAAQIDEGDTYEKMAAKGKKAGNLKQGTVRKRLNIPKGEKIPLSLINKELARLKKMEKRSDKNQKYYKALTLAKTLKTTTHKENIDPEVQKRHKGKAAPYGSAYEPVKEGDPKKGTGKKPKGSGRRLYTDEDPTDTVKVKFSTRQDIVDTLSKKSFKAKSHARQSQIINLIHQRVRAALSRAKDPAVKKRLRSAFEYIKKRKEASKRKTQRLKKEGMYPPYKANQVQQVRYKASDTFTRDPKKAKKLGYTEDIDEKKLTAAEKRAKERIVKGLKKTNLDKDAMYAIATAKAIQIAEELIYEELCKRGKAYIAARKRAGEKSSAYLSGRAVKVCKGLIKGTKGKRKKSYKKESITPVILKYLEENFFNHPHFAIVAEYNVVEGSIDESLKNWFEKEDWVRIDTQGNIAGKCGTMPKGKATQRCLPRAKANSLTKAQRAATSRKKVRGSKKGKQFVKNTKKAKVRLNKEGTFTKDWWLDVITEELLHEGGAAGHMAHPFDLPNVNTGKDLIKSFEQAADSLKKEPGAVKIDGVNASIRLINNDGKREFAMDRGSKKALDLKGVTKDDLEDRFGAGHGMIKAGANVLDIFNEALPSTESELRALGLWDNPNIMFNMEYVSGKSNVQDYGKNFLAIHGLLEVETKEVQGARKMLTKRVTTEKKFDQTDMDRYLEALKPFAEKKGFEIYGSVPTTFTKDPDFKKALGQQYKIEFAEGAKVKSLAQWLNDVTNIPATDRIKMNLETGGTKDVGALSKQVYFAVFGGETIDDLFDNEQDIQKAIQGATTYLATEKLGDEILDVLDSPMGSVNDHEGVVIRDPKIHDKPFKITGKFITGGVSSDFQKK